MPWPLTTATRDERTLVRMLYPTPLRIAPGTHDLVPGLCGTWHTSDERTWTFDCGSAAAAVARAIGIGRVTQRGTQVSVRLPFRWVRFPYALTGADEAVRSLPGPFALVHAQPGHIVMRRAGLTLDVTQVEPHRAEQLFREGKLDEAPVALGDIRAAQLDPALAPYVRVRQLLAVDTVVVRGIATPAIRSVWWHTADRADYDALVPESQAPTAVSLVPGWTPQRARPRDYRPAKSAIATLPLVRLDAVPALAYGASLLAANWRDLHPLAGDYRTHARLVRLAATYPLDEAILGQLDHSVLGVDSQRAAFVRADDALYKDASVIPIAWVVDARLVSPRISGWAEDDLGDVDYVKCRVTSRRP